MMHLVSGGGGGVYNFTWAGCGGRSDASMYPFSGITTAFFSCSTIFALFLRVFLCASNAAFTGALLSSTFKSAVYCSLASGVIVRPLTGRFSLSFVSGAALTEYQTHWGAPVVLNPAALTAAKSPLKSLNSASNRRREPFQRRFIY